MKIDLRWVDPNPGINVTTEIWRSTSPFNEDLVGADHIADVENNKTSYLDEDVILNETYHYRLVFKAKGYKDAVSQIYSFKNEPYNGPGSNVIEFGDVHFGYYGKLTLDLNCIPTINELRDYFGLPLYNENPEAFKFIVGGKVKAFYNLPLATGLELDINNPDIQLLLEKGSIEFNVGLHKWRLYLPTDTLDNTTVNDVSFFPGELLSMLDVTTDMYAAVIHNVYGNVTGRQLLSDSGSVNFNNTLSSLFPEVSLDSILTSHKEDNKISIVRWTNIGAIYPKRSKELTTEVIDYASLDWNKCIIWPVLEYVNLTHPDE